LSFNVNECKPLPRKYIASPYVAKHKMVEKNATSRPASPSYQGLTLVHFSAQRKRFLWDRGCIYHLGVVQWMSVRLRGY
jgi:hypothetical protein